MAIDTIFAGADAEDCSALKAAGRRLWLAFRAWYVKRQTRHALLGMTDDQLADIGISRHEAEREAAKSFYWD